jgi:hypothetical protein
MQRTLVASSLVLPLLFASLTCAGSVDLNLKPIARYDADTLDPLPFVAVNDTVISYQPGLYLMEISFTAQAGAGEKGWAGSSFDVTLTGNGLTKVGDSYQPNLGTTDFNGPGTLGGIVPIYQINGDQGLANDLNGIAAAIASPTISNANPFETRNYIGTPAGPPSAASPAWIGNFYVEWDGLSVGAVNLTNHNFNFTSTNGTPTNYGDDFFKSSEAGTGASSQFGRFHEVPPQIVDEIDPTPIQPGDPALYVNQLETIDPYDMLDAWSVVGLEMWAPSPGVVGSPPAELPGNPTVDNTGVFSWNTDGYPPGIYLWRLRAADTGGWSDDGFLSVRISAVPEPAAVVYGLGLISLLFYQPRSSRKSA